VLLGQLHDRCCCAVLQVLCLTGGQVPEVQFRSASRYTRVGYLRCSLTQLKCTADPETYTGPGERVDHLHVLPQAHLWTPG